MRLELISENTDTDVAKVLKVLLPLNAPLDIMPLRTQQIISIYPGNFRFFL